MISMNYTEQMLMKMYNDEYRISKYEIKECLVPNFADLNISIVSHIRNPWHYPETVNLYLTLPFNIYTDPVLLWEEISAEFIKFAPLPMDGNNILKDLCSK